MTSHRTTVDLSTAASFLTNPVNNLQSTRVIVVLPANKLLLRASDQHLDIASGTTRDVLKTSWATAMAAVLFGGPFGYAFVILCLVDNYPVNASVTALAVMNNPERSRATFGWRAAFDGDLSRGLDAHALQSTVAEVDHLAGVAAVAQSTAGAASQAGPWAFARTAGPVAERSDLWPAAAPEAAHFSAQLGVDEIQAGHAAGRAHHADDQPATTEVVITPVSQSERL